MIKRWLHILVLVAFVVSTMLGFAGAMPARHMQQAEPSAHHMDMHADHKQARDHSRCQDKQDAANNQSEHKKCRDGDCQCTMNSCAKTQTLHSSFMEAYVPVSMKTAFPPHNERADNIAYLLKHPPRT